MGCYRSLVHGAGIMNQTENISVEAWVRQGSEDDTYK